MTDKFKDGNRATDPEQKEGIFVNDLAAGAVIELETQNHHYTLVKRAGSQMMISGHPTLCPQPVPVRIEGSYAGRHMLSPQPGFIGRGMYLMFDHPIYHSVSTSRILEIHKLG